MRGDELEELASMRAEIRRLREELYFQRDLASRQRLMFEARIRELLDPIVRARMLQVQPIYLEQPAPRPTEEG